MRFDDFDHLGGEITTTPTRWLGLCFLVFMTLLQGISQPEGPEMSISGKKSSFFLLVYWRRPDTCPDALNEFFG